MDDQGAIVARYRGLLRAVYGERRWVLASDVLANLTDLASRLEALGATAALCIARSAGTGAPPDRAFAPVQCVLGDEARPPGGRHGSVQIMDALRGTIEALADVPADVQAAVDAFDPDGEALAIGPFYGDDRPIARRRVWGGRPAAWRALEDKTTIDAFWDQIGVLREPSETIAATDLASLRRASGALDRYGDGAVWVGDSSEGFNGGAEYVRRIRGPDDIDSASADLLPRCERIRVMPFLEGIPCSIHGIVFADQTIALRPCEMVVLRKPGAGFQYAGTGTLWDPPAADRAAMRAVAVKAGDELRGMVDYRGVFTVDGVMTARGFRPTELNPRFGGGIFRIGKPLAQLPLLLLHYAVCERDDLDWQPKRLEQLLLALGDEHRSAGGVALVNQAPTAPKALGLTVVNGDGEEPPKVRLFEAMDDPAAQWRVRFGPHPVGGFLGIEPKPGALKVGDSVASAMAEVLRGLDELWSLGLGPLEAPKSVR